jgi:DnaK suppressor protein
LNLALLAHDRERSLIRDIDLALRRLMEREYGYCAETGERIGIRRLEAFPVATLCLEAQERAERRAQQFSGPQRLTMSHLSRSERGIRRRRPVD